MSSPPPLPEPRADASLLTRRFGPETVNYYAGSRLNRYSFLRAAAASPAARFVVLARLAPLVTADRRRRLALLPPARVRALVGADPFALADDDALARFDSAAAPRRPLVVFLGPRRRHGPALVRRRRDPVRRPCRGRRRLPRGARGREVLEEAGVRVGRVVIHSTQPWPYPATLMLGAVAQALPGEDDIALNDGELESVRWFTMDEVRDALRRGAGPRDDPAPDGYQAGELRVPPPQAIANRLMTAVFDGFLTGNSKI